MKTDNAALTDMRACVAPALLGLQQCGDLPRASVRQPDRLLMEAGGG